MNLTLKDNILWIDIKRTKSVGKRNTLKERRPWKNENKDTKHDSKRGRKNSKFLHLRTITLREHMNIAMIFLKLIAN